MSHDPELIQKRLGSLRSEIAEGLEQARRGEFVPAEEAFERIRKESCERREGNGEVGRKADE